MRVDLKPLSTNRAWQGRRFKTKEHKQYEEELLWILKGYREPKITGPYSIHFKFHIKNYSRADLSNLIKTTEDIIVKAGLVDDDSKCVHMVIDKFKADTDYFEFTISPVTL